MNLKLLLIAIIISTNVKAQEWKKVLGQQTYKLNSDGGNIVWGGVSKIYVPINIPPNSTQLIYTIETFGGKENEAIANSINLIGQISQVTGVYGLAISAGTEIASKIVVNSTGGNVHSYLMNNINDAKNFVAKQRFSCFQNETHLNYLGGASVFMFDKSNSWQTLYLAIANPSSYRSTVVVVSAAVLIEEDKKQTVWTKQIKDEVYNYFVNYYMSNVPKDKITEEIKVQIPQMCECIITKLIELKTPEDFTNMAVYEQNTLGVKLQKECYKELGFTN